MTNEDYPLPIGDHILDELSEADAEKLYAAALEDQAVFDALMNVEDLRQVLADPAMRKELVRSLAPDPVQVQVPGVLERLASWMGTFPGKLTLASAMAAVFVLAFFHDGFGPPPEKPDVRTPTIAVAPGPGANLANLGQRLFSMIPAADSGTAALQFDPERVAPGERVRLVVRGRPGAPILIMEVRPDGSYGQHFPLAADRVPGNGELTIELEAGRAAGSHRVRLAVFPDDMDPETVWAVTDDARITVVERTYVVESSR